jgi:transglutaminase-like putative cysteine protease
MEYQKMLSDYKHPVIEAKAAELTKGKINQLEQIESIFYFVRDGIKFGFTPKHDQTRASDVIKYGLGFCNPKSTLFLALCKVLAIPARVHYGLINIEVMRGIFPSFIFPSLPKAGGHSWMEVQIDGEWKKMDSYEFESNGLSSGE